MIALVTIKQGEQVQLHYLVLCIDAYAWNQDFFHRVPFALQGAHICLHNYNSAAIFQDHVVLVSIIESLA